MSTLRITPSVQARDLILLNYMGDVTVKTYLEIVHTLGYCLPGCTRRQNVAQYMFGLLVRPSKHILGCVWRGILLDSF